MLECIQLRFLSFTGNFVNQLWRSLFKLCDVQRSWEDFCHVPSNELTKWLKFYLPPYNFTRKAVSGGLFFMLLVVKMQIIEQAQSLRG